MSDCARTKPRGKMLCLAIAAALPAAVAIGLRAQPAATTSTGPAATRLATTGATGPSATGTAATKPTTAVEYCVNDACHAKIVNRKVVHGPVAQAKCQACHKYDEPREHRFKLASASEKLCADCHTLTMRTTTHLPYAQGRCTGCHDPHGSDHRVLLIADPAQGLCLTCHKEDFAKRKFVHGPVSAGACILCHEAHASWQPKLLTQEPQKQCLSCHRELVPRAGEGRHVHEPARDNCSGCHDAHASDHKYQLRLEGRAMCFSCHKDIEKLIASSKVVHGSTIKDAACTGCHAPHFSQLAKLQKSPQPQVCLSCHDKPLKTAAGQELTNMAALLKDNPDHHGPIREGDCTACHRPHAGELFRLLTAEYPPDFYAPFKIETYKLCFECHIPEMVLRPQGMGLTRFRDGDRNLHFLHVNQEKGRTCRACHEVHASKQPFHIRQAVPFGTGGWMLDINFRQTPGGGTCTPGCHKTQTYTHGQAATMPSATRPATRPPG